MPSRGIREMNKRAKTHYDLFSQLIESINGLTEEITTRNDELKKAKDYDEITQIHNTRGIIRKWFMAEGNIPL